MANGKIGPNSHRLKPISNQRQGYSFSLGALVHMWDTKSFKGWGEVKYPPPYSEVPNRQADRNK